MSLKNKLLIAAAAIVLTLCLLVGLASYALLSQQRLGDLAVRIEAIPAQTLDLRRSEKDFLARRTLAERDGFDVKLARIRALLAEIDRRGAALGLADVHRHVLVLSAVVEAYAASFHRLAENEIAVGLNENDGLQGRMRTAIHAAEHIFTAAGSDRLDKDMLMLRRNEKDFMLRHEGAYLASHARNTAVLLADLDADTNLSAAQRQAAKAVVATYVDSFHDYAEGVKKSGLTPGDGLQGTMRAAVHRMDGATAAFQRDLGADLRAGMRHRLWELVVPSVLIGGLFVVALIGLGRSIVGPVRAMTQVMVALSSGDRAVPVPYTGRRDEIGAMAQSVSTFKEGLIRAERLDGEAKARQKADLDRGRKRDLLAADFDVMMRRVLEKLFGTVGRVKDASARLHTAAAEIGVRGSAVSDLVAQSTGNVQAVAGAAAQLGASTLDISRRVQDTTRITQEAVDGVRTADTTIDGLSTAAQKIGEIVKLITDIAGQTNLLALNATIEAARAGEAGKGFAVVAGEVKNLANQTARATSEIAEQVSGIQRSAQASVAAMKSVGAAIEQVNSVIGSIAAAVEEQNAATADIARNAAEAAAGTRMVEGNIAEVSAAAATTTGMAEQMEAVAGLLEQDGKGLARHVETFLGTMKAV
ncbi:methyl-accepting chemotaxis protein 4 [mine drainage metagenome]|uniref:Methyl-accepting chemotaxis protein 4 n=1 Tax=mine drainage metagenome TaxID=410659 RepID=A0A1J5S2F8_9ZZZZ